VSAKVRFPISKHLAITVILIALASAFADDDEHGHQDDDHEHHGVIDPRGSRPRKGFSN